MKKLLFVILTATAIISVASCSGNNKSSEKKATTEQTDPKGNDQATPAATPVATPEPAAEPVAPALTAEEYAVDMFQQMYAAGEADDLATFTKLAKEFDAWWKTLSDEDLEKAQEAIFAWDEEKADMVLEAANHVLGY